MLEGLASSASETERRADKASQDINQFLRCQYLADCLGEFYEGRVAHVSKLGAFVLLDELAIEGLIPFRAIRDQLGRLSVLPYALVSDATGKRLSMGDEVTVQLSRVDEKLGHIEFELVEQKTSRSRHFTKPRRLSSSEVEKAGKRGKGFKQSDPPSREEPRFPRTVLKNAMKRLMDRGLHRGNRGQNNHKRRSDPRSDQGRSKESSRRKIREW